jgi:predicted transcriptional regulator YdeE
METFNLKRDIKVFGQQVVRFPQGVKEAFDELVHIVPEGLKRAYYGISKMDKDGNIMYYAAVEETVDGEGKKYGYDYYTIEHGKYLAEPVKDWQANIACIKDVFGEMMKDKRYDETKPCVEWYKDDKEMLCMLKTKDRKK